MAPFVVLIDMDNVLTDFEGRFVEHWQQMFPHVPYVPVSERNTFYLHQQYPVEHRPMIEALLYSQGHFLEMKPIPGAIDALRWLEDQPDTEVFIVTTPINDAPYCAYEKMQWVTRHLGESWLPRVVMCSDKTAVVGDVIFDDRPVLKGALPPQWEHVLFTCPCNQHIRVPSEETSALCRLDDWSDPGPLQSLLLRLREKRLHRG